MSIEEQETPTPATPEDREREAFSSEPPAAFGTWGRMYFLVLLNTAILYALLAWFSSLSR